MGPIADLTPFDPNTNSKPNLLTAPGKERGFRPGPAGAPSVDSAVESWEESSAGTHRTRSSVGERMLTCDCVILCSKVYGYY